MVVAIIEAVIINQILSVAGLEARRIVVTIVVLKVMRRVSIIMDVDYYLNYRLKNCTLSLGVKGLCALYTNL